jgi:hypothetical protein
MKAEAATMFDWLKVSTKSDAPLNADTSAVGPEAQVKQPAFVTTASLNTFAGGSVFITVVWKVVTKIFDTDGLWVPAILAAILGIFFFFQAMEGGKLKGSAIMGAFLVALVNACILWSAAVGLDVGLDEASVVDTAANG